MTTQTANPLLDPGFEIPFDRIRPEDAEPAIDALIAEARANLERLARAGERHFERFLPDLDQLTERLSTARTIVGHLEGVVSSDGWRAAAQAIIPKVSAFFTDLNLHEGLWTALKTYAAGEEAQQLDPIWARFLKLTMDEFRRQGADLDEAGKARLKALNTELAQVTNTFSQNTLDGVAAFELFVPESRLAGVPERVRVATRLDAAARGQDGHRLTLHMPVYLPVLTHALDRELRRELWQAYHRVGTLEGKDNRPLIAEILRLRQEKAQLLGFSNFADLVLDDRMAGTGAAAQAFERDLTERTRPAFERERADLEAFYRERAGEHAPALEPWDVEHWVEQQRLARYDLNEETLRPYFPLDRVLSGLFEIAGRIFGITVREGQAPGWHPEVRAFDLFDEAGTHRASFYTDWFPRDSKRGGAWMNQFITGGPSDHGFRPHLALMCGNLTPPSEGAPALLSHDEVQTVFHEFGHLLHGCLSTVPVRSLAGTRVAWDFVELPSQIMENWCWDREALALYARHVETQEPIPTELFEKMLAARTYRAATGAMRQYSFGTTDLALHMDLQAGQEPVAFARDVTRPFMPTPIPDDYARIAQFGHLFSSPVGYAAGYYSYKWAEVLDADAFSRFATEGLYNRAIGQAFVDAVLSRGNSADPTTLYREFMGRDPNPEALLRRDGLI